MHQLMVAGLFQQIYNPLVPVALHGPLLTDESGLPRYWSAIWSVAGGQSLPYSTYDRVGVIDQGAVVNHKRLSHALRAAQLLQVQRDDRVVNKPSTAHRVDGLRVPKKKVHGTRSQRELGYDDLHAAIQALSTSKVSIDEVAKWKVRRGHF